jgi:murein DD-endopeptidase MepM/ murein hydrolase activator NlpD
MAYFDFSISDMANGGTMANAVFGNTKNYTPLGNLQAIKTSESLGEGKKSLTSWNVSDILQNNVTMKPVGINYTQFNEEASKMANYAYTAKIGGTHADIGVRNYLVGFDTMNTPKDQLILDGIINGTGTSNSVTDGNGHPAPPSSGFILPTGQYRYPTHKTHYTDAASGTTAMDIGADSGTPVFSPWSGVVSYIGYPNGGTISPGASLDVNGGNGIVIMGDNGYCIYMCHFMSPPIVGMDSRVTKGQNVAFVGETGRAFGAHVHVSVGQGVWTSVFNNPIDNIWDFMKEIEIQSGASANQVATN